MDALNDQYVELGTVLVKARSLTSDIFSDGKYFWRNLNKSAASKALGLDNKSDRDRLFLAAEFLRSHLWSAAFSANCYFLYYDIFARGADMATFDDVVQAACDAAHTYADVVPIEIFNAMQIVRAPEIQELSTDSGREALLAFNYAFSKVKDARDAIAHAHDRSFSRCYGAKLDSAVGGRPICRSGKNYVASDGTDFLFDFKIEKFVQLLSRLEKSFDL